MPPEAFVVLSWFSCADPGITSRMAGRVPAPAMKLFSTSVMPSEREPQSGERAERHPDHACSLKVDARHFFVNVPAALRRHNSKAGWPTQSPGFLFSSTMSRGALPFAQLRVG
jgi:hypothetical protein